MSATTTEKFSITLSDGNTHKVEADTLKAATTKLLKRKAIKDAGLTVVETPTDDVAPDGDAPDTDTTGSTETTEPTPAPAPVERNLIAELPAIVAAYFAEEASTDPLAPMHGAPFKTNDRLFLQLEGRGGAGKGTDDFTPTGLRPFIVRTEGDSTPGKMVIQKALITLGFERKPFSYNHPERGSSSASYYSRPALGFGAVAPVDARVAAPRGKKSGTNVNPTHSVSDDPIIPQRPEGSDEDVAKLNELWNAYIDAQNAAKAQSAENGRNPIKKDASAAVKAAAKEARETRAAELKGAMNEAHEALLDHRRTMHSKNEAAARTDVTTETTGADAA